LINYNEVTAPYTGVTGVKPLIETVLDLSWDSDPWNSTLTDLMTHPVISRPLYDRALAATQQEAAPRKGAAAFLQPSPLPSSSASSRTVSEEESEMSFNSTTNDSIQATSPPRSGDTPETL
jgi:hypothetical protein